jgi:hypothetical protein
VPRPPSPSKSVFINCPFDDGYRPIFEALVFAVYFLGFKARCAREADDSGEVRIAKIERIIEECNYGIHDISEVGLDLVNRLPRFNMPLELGMFLACKRFGGKSQKGKKCLILDVEQYRYQRFISDIAGQDIRDHARQPDRAIIAVRNWLAMASRRRHFPGGTAVVAHYQRFIGDLPRLAAEAELDADALTFRDLSNLIVLWLRARR